MKRKLAIKLASWNNTPNKKPLMIIGARQVGKTYLINEFCQQNYQEYYYFNLFDRSDIVALFKENVNTDVKIKRLELIIGHKVDFDNAILFFDEIQESEELISTLKYFAESQTGYSIICAGSLLGVKLHRFSKSFPVGKVELLNMHAMDLEEYFWAFDEAGLSDEIRNCYSTGQPMSKPLHDRALELYRAYLCTGGLPEAVQQITSVHGDVLRFEDSILNNIITSYLSDMNKYLLSTMEGSRIEAIYKSIPSQLNNKSGKFQYAKVDKSARSRDYETALNWLVSSEMILQSTAVEIPKMPLKGYEKSGYFKLYLSDPGLLRYQLRIRSADIMLDRPFELMGVISESFVASQLASLGIPLNYWHEANRAEVDFLLDTIDGIIPIEVKSGQNKRSSSLRLFSERYAPPYSIRILQKNFGLVNDIRTIPLYAVYCLG